LTLPSHSCVSRHLTSRTLVDVFSWSPLLSTLVAAVTGAALNDAAQAIYASVGGGAAVGSALACAREIRHDEPHWDQAMGTGAAFGAVAGAGLLVAQMVGIA